MLAFVPKNAALLENGLVLQTTIYSALLHWVHLSKAFMWPMRSV